MPTPSAPTEFPEDTMKRWMTAMIAGAALAVPAAAHASDEDGSLDRRLADAQRRLEDAAREVAELSGEAAGEDGRAFRWFAPAPRRAMLGVNLGSALPSGGGVQVESVSPGGPAAEAGVKAGDVIVAIASKPVTTGRELVRAMESVEPGEKVELGLTRAGKKLALAVEARPVDRMFFVGTPGMHAIPAMPALPAMPAIQALEGAPFESEFHWLLDDWGDAEFVTLTPGLGRYFGADSGVLVARAPEDASLGLQDGDVIVSIGGREPQSGRHAMRILRSYQPGESVDLGILRDRKSQTLKARIPERTAQAAPRHRAAPRAPVAPAPPPPPPAPPSPGAAST
jgi:membrane-associated protease RseP (regulator of RpoE activity)